MNRAAKYLLWAFTALVAHGEPLDNWTWRNPLPTGSSVFDVTYADGRFVAVGQAGAVLVSTDAANWIEPQVPTDDTLVAVTYGNGKWVAVGDGALPGANSVVSIITSSDSTNWLNASAATTNALWDVAFGNGTFVAVGQSETIVTSTNGTDWTKRRETPLGRPLISVVYGNGLFMAVTDGAIVLTSPDGVTWTSQPPFGVQFLKLTFGKGKFLAEYREPVGPFYQPRLATTDDGTAWTTSPQYPPGFAALGFDATRFVIIGAGPSASNVVYTSTNGFTWLTNQVFGVTNSSFRAIAFGGGDYIVISPPPFVSSYPGLFRSPDLQQWAAIGSSLPLSAAHVFLFGNNKYVLAGSGPILVSTNGVHYETNVTVGTFSAGAFGTNTFILAAGGGSIVTSTNASNWTTRATGGSSINALTYGSNTFVAVGSNGDIRVSAAGTSWSGRFSGTTVHLRGVAYGNGIFVVAGDSGAILTSPDTVNWTIQDSGTTATLRGVAFGNGVFFATGHAGTVRVSTDGVAWHPVASGTTDDLLAGGTSRGHLLIAGSAGVTGDDSTVLSSIDGFNWRRHRVPLTNARVIGVTPRTFVLLGINAAVVESGELSPLALWAPSYSKTSGFRVAVRAETNLATRLQRTTNFVNWEDVLTFTNAMVPTTVTDSAATNAACGFYRVVSP